MTALEGIRMVKVRQRSVGYRFFRRYGMCIEIENLVMQINCCLKAKNAELAIAF